MAREFTYKDFKKEYVKFKDADDMAMFVLFEPVFFAWKDAIPCYGIDDRAFSYTFEQGADQQIYSIEKKIVEGTVRKECIRCSQYRTSIEFKSIGLAKDDEAKELESRAIQGFRNFFRKELGLDGLMSVGKEEMHSAIHYYDYTGSYNETGKPEEFLHTDAALQVGESAIAFYFGEKIAKQIIEQAQLDRKDGNVQRPRISCCPT